MASLLVVEKVTKSFGKLLAVDGVSFEVGENEIFGIAGPNGAGKTTLFNVISGVPYHATSGRIFFAGESIESSPAHRICHLGVARTFQKETLFETLSVFENVLVGAAYSRRGLGSETAEEGAIKALEFVGLADKVDQQAVHLALFEKKLLMLASALATRPELLLFDEPAAGLNQREMNRSADLFWQINAAGMAIVLIEHQLPLLLKVSNRVMILNEGKKLVEGPPDSVVRDARVVEAYLGQRGKRAAE